MSIDKEMGRQVGMECDARMRGMSVTHPAERHLMEQISLPPRQPNVRCDRRDLL